MKKQIFLLIIFLVLTINFSYAITNEEPPKNIEVNIPEYKTYKIGVWDYADIPGGKVLLVEGKPRAPYYSISIDYPSGYKVQDVIMKERSGMETAVGLNLSIVTMIPRSSLSNSLPSNERNGWYPEEDYRWEVLIKSDGSSTLFIDIYPFYYNVNTTEVKFYRHYKFDITYIFSSVSIINMITDKDVYDIGDKVTVNVFLNNSGKAQDIVAYALVKQHGSNIAIDGLPLRTLPNIIGYASFSMVWDSKGFPADDYYLEVTLNDTSGNWLDRGTCEFRLGRSMINVTSFSIVPQHFKIGDEVKIMLEALNTGSTTLNGRCIFIIQKENGSSILYFYHNFSSLTPKSSINFTSIWNTSSAEKGVFYYIVGYISYEGQTTPLMAAMASTNYLPMARFSYTPTKVGLGEEVTFDASASSDSDGSISSYKWDFGDGGKGSGVNVKHSYHGLGDYIVTLTVIDNEGGSNSTMKLIRVVMMYTLNVSSNVAVEIPGSGRYKERDEATLSAPSSVSMPALLGLLGAKYVFKQWVGFLNSTESSVRLVFAGYEPRLEMHAVYAEDYTGAIIVASVLVAVAVVVVAVSLRRRKSTKLPRPPELPPPG